MQPHLVEPTSEEDICKQQRLPDGASDDLGSNQTVAKWETCISVDKDMAQLRVLMARQRLLDQDIAVWCRWFQNYLEQYTFGKDESIVASIVDFSENYLTDAGVQLLLETLRARGIIVEVLKLHHNHIQSGDSIADLVLGCSGSLRELHLSHNELSTEAAAQIILAVASTTDSQGEFCYPHSEGDVVAPLWLRLDLNRLDHLQLQESIRPTLEKIGRADWALCDARGVGCKPRCCEWHQHDPPPMHVKHLAHQRGKAVTEEMPALRQEDVDCLVHVSDEATSSGSDAKYVYNRDFMLLARSRIDSDLKEGSPLIKSLVIPNHLVAELCEVTETADRHENVELAQQSCKHAFDPGMFPTWEDYVPAIDHGLVDWNWSEPKRLQSTSLLSTEPQESEYAQLLSILRRNPENVVSLTSLREQAPPLLRRLVYDATTLRSWLQQCMGTVKVFGQPGAEMVGFEDTASAACDELGSQQGEQADSASQEVDRFSFNPQAVDFVPSWCATLNPEAAEFVPVTSSSSSSPEPAANVSQDTSFSDEEQLKLLGAQLCRDLSDFDIDASPGSARTSAGTEEAEATSEGATEEEEEHVAFAAAEVIIA